MLSRATLIVPALALGPTAAAGGLHQVPGDYPTIQIAVNFADSGDTIEVSPGIYFETIDLSGKTLALRSTGGPDVTTINALGQLQTAVTIASGEGPETVLEGFTITNGDGELGGGIHVNGTSPSIIDCIILGNTASNVGGGIFSDNGDPTIKECRFDGNTATVSGGGIFVSDGDATVEDCMFIMNTADYGGGVRILRSGTVLSDCRFETNTANIDGGAAYANDLPSPSWHRCVFDGNASTTGRGGAVFVRICNPTLSNCVFDQSTAGANGGAVAMYDGGTMTVRHCTFARNHTDGGGAGGAIYTQGNATTNATNCVAWWNTPDQFNSATTASYCNLDQSFAGTGNIIADPLFVNLVEGDLRLQAGSPSIDAGNTTLVQDPYPLDHEGTDRAVDDPATTDTGVALLGLSVDMGAYEFQPEGPVPTCPGDVDGDGVIGVGDLVAIITNWGVCP